jgi:hypothetical protein
VDSSGAKGAGCGLVNTHLADACVLTKRRKYNVFLPTLVLACARHGSKGPTS